MTPSPEPRPNESPVYDAGRRETYSLEIMAEITGISSQSILHYQQHGLVRPAAGSGDFDDDAVHTLRRIEHLRQTCEANLAGLKLILGLMEQVDYLKSALRARR